MKFEEEIWAKILSKTADPADGLRLSQIIGAWLSTREKAEAIELQIVSSQIRPNNSFLAAKSTFNNRHGDLFHPRFKIRLKACCLPLRQQFP